MNRASGVLGAGTVTVRIPTALREFTGGTAELAVPARRVEEAIETIAMEFPDLRHRIVNSDGELRPFIRVFVGDREIRSLNGLGTRIGPGDVLSIIPAVAGG